MRLKFTHVICGLSILLFNQAALANIQYYLSPNSMADFSFPPNKEVSLSNPFFFPVKGRCTLSTEAKESRFDGRVEKKSASLKNNSTGESISLHSGQSGSMMVHNRDTLTIEAKPNAKVVLINRGNQTVNASCDLL